MTHTIDIDNPLAIAGVIDELRDERERAEAELDATEARVTRLIQRERALTDLYYTLTGSVYPGATAPAAGRR